MSVWYTMYDMPAYSYTCVPQFRFGGMVAVKCGTWGILIESMSWSPKKVRVCYMFPENVMKDHNG